MHVFRNDRLRLFLSDFVVGMQKPHRGWSRFTIDDIALPAKSARITVAEDSGSGTVVAYSPYSYNVQV
jgi:hypothetical protein